ncbi:unnamed protein product [marine sediment metagenome]|uniref:Uncharacterized protein n=1 Tax=marine sediment metagenome TaxID=412755 RepID=X1KGR8_9ZZZZ
MDIINQAQQFVMWILKLNTDVLGVQLVTLMLEREQRADLDIVQETTLNALVNGVNGSPGPIG